MSLIDKAIVRKKMLICYLLLLWGLANLEGGFLWAQQPLPLPLTRVLLIGGQNPLTLGDQSNPIIFGLTQLGSILEHGYGCRQVEFVIGEQTKRKDVLDKIRNMLLALGKEKGFSMIIFYGGGVKVENEWGWLLGGDDPTNLRPILWKDWDQIFQGISRSLWRNCLILSSVPIGPDEVSENQRVDVTFAAVDVPKFPILMSYPSEYSRSMAYQPMEHHYMWMSELIKFFLRTESKTFSFYHLLLYLNQPSLNFNMVVKKWEQELDVKAVLNGPSFSRIQDIENLSTSFYLFNHLNGDLWVDGIFMGRVIAGYKYPVGNLLPGQHLVKISSIGGTSWYHWVRTSLATGQPSPIFTPVESKPPSLPKTETTTQLPVSPSLEKPQLNEKPSGSSAPLTSPPKIPDPGSVPGEVRPPSSLLPLPKGAFSIPGTQLTMNYILPGTFSMGSDAEKLESPKHTVIITRPFWMSVTEVTRGDYKMIMGLPPDKDKTVLKFPITEITWYDALQFCGKLMEQVKLRYSFPENYEIRLPTEAEWEYGCRCGIMNWGEPGKNPDKLEEFVVAGTRAVESVASRKPNPWGFYDMLGNVAEWCLDAELSRPRQGPPTYQDGIHDPLNLTGPARVFRGGSYRERVAGLRPSMRDVYYPTRASGIIGFRIVIAPKMEKPTDKPKPLIR